jgi:hypothetical protein
MIAKIIRSRGQTSNKKGKAMLQDSKMFVLSPAICALMFIVPSSANALDVVAEVRGDVAYIEGSGAGRKQEIYWDVGSGPVLVTKANPKGNFSFEGFLPEGCPPDNCVGWISAGIDGTAESVTIDYQPVEPVAELTLVASAIDAHAGSPVRAVGFFADGRVVSGGEDAYLRGWEWEDAAPNLEERITQGLDHTIYDLAVWTHKPVVITGEGGWNGSANSDTLRVYDDDLESIRFGITAPIGYVYTVEVAPGPAPSGTVYPEWTVASGFYGEIAVYRTDGLLPCATKATKKKRTKALKFSSDARLLASTSTSSRIQVWSFDQLTCELDLRLSLSHSGSWYFPIDFAPGSTAADAKIVSGTDGGTIKVWTIGEPGGSVTVQSVDSGAVYALDWSPVGDMIVAAGSGDITVYDSSTLSVLFRKSDAHRSRVNDVAFYVDPVTNTQWIVSGGADGDLKLWSVPARDPAP